MSRTLLVMAAGTGGHVFPGIAIAKDKRDGITRYQIEVGA